MARPKNKSDLVALSNKNYEKLLSYVDSFPENELEAEFPEGTLNRNIRDVLAHLHHWHLMVMDWYEVGMKGEKPDIPAKGYNWRTLPDLNKKIRKQYETTGLNEVRNMLGDSFAEIQNLIENHSDDELFERKRFKWTGNNALGAYFVSVSSSHYDWAYKLIKRCKK